MREQRKAERMQILGINMDSIRVDRAINLTSHYLERNKFEYIAFVNTTGALAGHEEEEFTSFMDQAALVLPGDNNIEDAVGIRQWIEEGTSYQAEFFRRLLSRMNRQRASVYYMVQKEEELARVKSIFSKHYEKIQLETTLWQEDTNVDSMVNEINIQAPDILIICGDYGRICAFLKEHGCKINAGLCFCMETIMSNDDPAVPEWIQKANLNKLYIWFIKKPLTFWHDLLFKRTMKKTIMEESDNTKKTVQDDEKM